MYAFVIVIIVLVGDHSDWSLAESVVMTLILINLRATDIIHTVALGSTFFVLRSFRKVDQTHPYFPLLGLN